MSFFFTKSLANTDFFVGIVWRSVAASSSFSSEVRNLINSIDHSFSLPRCSPLIENPFGEDHRSAPEAGFCNFGKWCDGQNRYPPFHTGPGPITVMIIPTFPSLKRTSAIS